MSRDVSCLIRLPPTVRTPPKTVTNAQLDVWTILLCSLSILGCAPDKKPQAAQRDGFPGPVRLVLPEVIHATPGVQSNVYFDAAVLVTNPTNYVFDVTCPKGNQYDDCWTFTPKPEEAGDYLLMIEVREQSNDVIARARFTVHVAPADAAGDVTLLAFGDSHLQRDTYLQTVLDLSKADPAVALTLVGSRGRGNKPPADDLRHEGYNGWTAEAFVTRDRPKPCTGHYVPAETGSPFLYDDANGAAKLDMAAYCREFNDGRSLDFVLLGARRERLWSATDDDIDATIDAVFGYFDRLIEMVHAHGPQTRIGIVMLDSPARSQHGFRNYAGTRKQTRWQYRRNQHRMVERELARYGRREAENLFLVPVYLCIDPIRGFPMRSLPINSRMPAKEDRVNDGAHHSAEGYMQFGDPIYAWIKCVLAEQNGRAATQPSR